MASDIARRVVVPCWGCRASINDDLAVSGRFGVYELGGSLTPKAALFTILLKSQVFEPWR